MTSWDDFFVAYIVVLALVVLVSVAVEAWRELTMSNTDHLRELAEMFDGPNGWAEKAVWRDDVASALREAATAIDTLKAEREEAESALAALRAENERMENESRDTNGLTWYERWRGAVEAVTIWRDDAEMLRARLSRIEEAARAAVVAWDGPRSVENVAEPFDALRSALSAPDEGPPSTPCPTYSGNVWTDRPALRSAPVPEPTEEQARE